MGMYTEICLNVRLVKDLPSDTEHVLKYLCGDAERPKELPAHPFFDCDRWDIVLRCSSYYFVPFSWQNMRFNEISGCYYLCARADLKNYDSEIEKFFAWLDPYIDTHAGEFIGYSRYEESDTPTLYFKKEQA